MDSFAGKAPKPIMFTRFQTASVVHVLNAPLIEIPPDTPRAMFLGALGGAYEYEEEHLRSRLLQFAADLEVALQQRELITRPGIEAFVVGLRAVMEFLNSVDENAVRLYSYERAPSIEDLLDAFGNGGGANDWALEELRKKGEKGRKALLSVLKRNKTKANSLRQFQCCWLSSEMTKQRRPFRHSSTNAKRTLVKTPHCCWRPMAPLSQRTKRCTGGAGDFDFDGKSFTAAP